MSHTRSELEDARAGLLWETVSTSVLAECKIFSVKKVVSTSMCVERKKSTFFTLGCSSWVNIIPVTADNEVIMVEQYRHGIEDLTLEIPGGCVDATDADACAAAQRELREETGCIAERWSLLGKNHPNPALQDNLCYTYLAEGVRAVETPRFDNTGTERLVSRLIALSEIDNLIRNGTIKHSLVITAFHYLALTRPELLKS